jgi:hypothetical protein
MEWPGYDEEVQRFTEQARKQFALEDMDPLELAQTELMMAMDSEKGAISDIREEL